MESLSEVSLSEFRNVLTSDEARLLKSIYFTIVLGLVLFALLPFIAIKGHSNYPTDKGLLGIIDVLTWINIILTMVILLVQKFISMKQYGEENLKKAFYKEFKYFDGHLIGTTPAEKCLRIIRISLVSRLLLLAGSAFLGIFVVVLLRFVGGGSDVKIYYLNILTVIPPVIYGIATFPTEKRLLEIFEARIQQNR